MANLLQTIKDIFAKAGITEANEHLAKMLESSAVASLKDVEVDVALSNIVNQKLITVEGAKAHKDVSAHFKNSYFGSIDVKLRRALEEAGMTEEAIAEIEKNGTEARIGEALKQAIKIKSSQNNNEEVAALRNTLNLAKESAAKEKDALNLALDASQKSFKTFQKNGALAQSLTGYAFVETLKKEQVERLLTAEIDAALAVRKATLEFENGAFSLRSAENPTLEYFDTEKGKTITFKEFIDGVVASSGLQKTAETAPRPSAQSFQANANGSALSVAQTSFMAKFKDQ